MADADRLYDEAAVLEDTINGTLHVTVMGVKVSGFSVNTVLQVRAFAMLLLLIYGGLKLRFYFELQMLKTPDFMKVV
jgi:hypothetical protein